MMSLLRDLDEFAKDVFVGLLVIIVSLMILITRPILWLAQILEDGDGR